MENQEKNCFERPPFHVAGYDKDGGVYERLCQAHTKERANEIATAITHYHVNLKELRRSATGEPFDWFVVMDDCCAICRTFTAEHPDGF